jgi:hypothetical protein
MPKSCHHSKSRPQSSMSKPSNAFSLPSSKAAATDCLSLCLSKSNIQKSKIPLFMRYFVTFATALASCFAAQALALRSSGGRFTKSESNFFSSVGRIQAGTVGKPKVMLLGSSITGRLPDRAQGFAGFANMGCDGGSALDSLRAMDAGILPVAPVLVIEANTLSRALGATSSEVGQAMGRPWFGIGMKVPAVSAYARPSAFFYSLLLARRVGDYGDPESGGSLEVRSMPTALAAKEGVDLSSREAELKDEVVALVRRLSAKGGKVVFVWLPPGRSDGSGIPDWIHATIAESGSLWWDLGQEADKQLVTLTDGVHMAAPSAARTVISLREGLRRR